MFLKKENMLECILIGEKNGEKYFAVREDSIEEKYFVARYFHNKILVSNKDPMFDTIKECRKAFRIIKNK